MSYAALADVLAQISEDELVQLTDDSHVGAVDEAIVTSAVADASEEIDGYVGSKYALPLSSMPGILKKLCVDVAIYNLYARRHDSIPDMRKDRYENAIKFLMAVAAGKISLGVQDPGGSPPASGVGVTGADQVMTSDKLSRF